MNDVGKLMMSAGGVLIALCVIALILLVVWLIAGTVFTIIVAAIVVLFAVGAWRSGAA
jgi:hypothetical protein